MSADRWVPVGERLPDPYADDVMYSDDVLVWAQNERLVAHAHFFLDGKPDWLDSRDRVVYGVTHWQPLPEPPPD